MSLPTIVANDFYVMAAQGNIDNYSVDKILGQNAAVGGTEDIWNQGGSITQVATAAKLYVSSSSASDITQFVTIVGLDANYDEITETIGFLTGQTKVAGTKLFLRVNDVRLAAQPWPVTPATAEALLYVSSSSGADTTQYVTLNGFDDDGVAVVERVALNGQTRVASVGKFLTFTSATLSAACAGNVYVYYFSAITAGVPDVVSKIQYVSPASLAAVGDVYVFYSDTTTGGVPDTASKIQAKVDATALQAYNAIYTVPRNKNRYMSSLRYQSTGSTTTHNVILSIIRKLYGGSNETLETIKYVDLATTNYVDNQVQFLDQQLVFPAKSELRITAGLAGGTALNIALEASVVDEHIDAVPTTVTLKDLAAYKTFLTDNSRTIASQNYWLIGLDTYPADAAVPTTANLDDVLTTITGTTSYKVAADTEVVFDPAYYVSGKLVQTTKKAVLTLMRCVDSAAAVTYVLAPNQTLINIRNVKKIKYLA